MLYFDNLEAAGYLPLLLDPRDPRSPQEQLNETYAHGGGWNSFEGFTLQRNVGGDGREYFSLHFPGDPPMREISRAQLRDKTIVLFQYSWLAVIEADGTYDVARVD